MCGFFLANFPCWIDFYPLQCALFSLFGKKTTQKFADYKFSCTFATAIENETIGRLAQLVQSICLTSRGSAVRIRQRPLNEFLVNHCFFFLGRLAQLVQSICLTSRGSAVRIRQRPHRNIIVNFPPIGRLAQLVQSICLTSRGSAVRIRQRPHEQKSPMRLITKEIIIGYELMRFASARPFLSNGSYLSLFKCK